MQVVRYKVKFRLNKGQQDFGLGEPGVFSIGVQEFRHPDGIDRNSADFLRMVLDNAADLRTALIDVVIVPIDEDDLQVA